MWKMISGKVRDMEKAREKNLIEKIDEEIPMVKEWLK